MIGSAFRDRHVGDRQAIDIDAESREIGRDQAGAELRGGKPHLAIPVVERAIGRARRIARPMRRPEALDAAAFLVDQDRRLAADDGAKFLDQPAQAVRLSDVALEDDEAPGLRLLEELPLSGRERGPASPVMKARICGRLARAARGGQACGRQFLWTMHCRRQPSGSSTFRRPVPSRRRGRPARGNRRPWRRDRRAGPIGCVAAELARKFGLQRTERRLGLGLAALRRDLDRITAAGRR